MGSADRIDVYLEIGAKRTFAGALDWPGWSRRGRDEKSALAALADYGPRYAAAPRRGGIDFDPPDDSAAFKVVERLEGNATTDFGRPGWDALLDPAIPARFPTTQYGHIMSEIVRRGRILRLDAPPPYHPEESS